MTTPSSVQASTPAPVPIKLGEHDYMVVPQRIGRLRSRLGQALGDLGDVEFDSTGDGIVAMLGDRAHAVLAVFIPDLMPAYEFLGFPTKEALEKGGYDEEYDRSPDPAQIVTAFETAMAANRFDLFKHLGKLIGPDLLRATAARAVDRAMPMIDSPSSPAESGESLSTPSTTPDRTSDGGESPETSENGANGSHPMATASPSPG